MVAIFWVPAAFTNENDSAESSIPTTLALAAVSASRSIVDCDWAYGAEDLVRGGVLPEALDPRLAPRLMIFGLDLPHHRRLSRQLLAATGDDVVAEGEHVVEGGAEGVSEVAPMADEAELGPGRNPVAAERTA